MLISVPPVQFGRGFVTGRVAPSSSWHSWRKVNTLILTVVSCVRRTRQVFRCPVAPTCGWPSPAAWPVRCAWRTASRAAWCPSNRALPGCTALACSRSPAARTAAAAARLPCWSARSPRSSRPLYTPPETQSTWTDVAFTW